MIEEGYAWPGTLAVASDSHSNMYGGVGCLTRGSNGRCGYLVNYEDMVVDSASG
jgi:hypothetical protein